jgi:GT2 family glycosyltransferase
MVGREFPDVKVIEMAANGGCIARNRAVEHAVADIVVGLDDDVVFDTPDELGRVLRFFQERPNVHVLGFKILDGATSKIARKNWFHPRSLDEYGESPFESDYIAEGASAFRRSAFLDAGGYPDFFLGHEGYDLAYRMIDRGYRIMYFPGVVVRHFPSCQNREPWRVAYYGTRNQIWLTARNFPIAKAIRYLSYKLLAMVVYSALQRHLKWYLRGIRDGLRSFQAQRASGHILSREALSRLRRLRSRCQGPVGRLRQFLLRLRRDGERG